MNELRNTVSDAASTVYIPEISVVSRSSTVTENHHANLQRHLLKRPAKSKYFEVRRLTSVFSAGQKKQSIRRDVFNAEPVRRKVVIFCRINYVRARWTETPLAFPKRDLKQVVITRISAPFVEYNTTSNMQVYYRRIQNLHSDQDEPLTNLENYDNHFTLVFDLTSTQQLNQKLTIGKLSQRSYVLSWNF